MKKNYVLAICAVLCSLLTYGQNAIVGTGFSDG